MKTVKSAIQHKKTSIALNKNKDESVNSDSTGIIMLTMTVCIMHRNCNVNSVSWTKWAENCILTKKRKVSGSNDNEEYLYFYPPSKTKAERSDFQHP